MLLKQDRLVLIMKDGQIYKNTQRLSPRSALLPEHSTEIRYICH